MLRRRQRYTSVALYFITITIIVYLLNENYVLKIKLKTVEPPKLSRREDIALPLPKSTSTPPRVREFTPSNLTILLFNTTGGYDDDSFNVQLENLKKKFPSSQFLWNKKRQGLGKSLNLLLPRVKTEYFLFLQPRSSLSDRPREAIASLWTALEQFPELDFVGGTYLSHGRLYVSCHRFRLCRWTFSESYEYERSPDNLMICEGISASFMGRTTSVKKMNEGFDENMSDLLVVKDFFLRAKSNDVVAGTRPNVFFLINRFKTLYELWGSGDITKEIVPFAVKHKVFLFKDIDGKVIDICSPTSPLSGKGLCVETNSHKQMLDGGHWAYQGIFTYPYMLKYLEVTLSELAKFFNQHNVSYFVDGGISLGAIKMRSILPWEAGDIDMGVYDMTQDKLYDLLQPLIEQKGWVVQKIPNQVQVFCTPKNVGVLSGGLATIFYNNAKAPARSEFVEVQTNGVWIRYKRDLVSHLMHDYSKRYLEHKLYASSETASCKIKGHNACLPHFKTMLEGRAGTFRNFFCEE